MSLRFREKIQALLWWSDNSLRVELRMVQTQASLRKLHSRGADQFFSTSVYAVIQVLTRSVSTKPIRINRIRAAYFLNAVSWLAFRPLSLGAPRRRRLKQQRGRLRCGT